MTTLAAIVVTYNRLDQLKITVARLLAEGPEHLIVVDNASRSETGDWLESQTDPRLHVVRLAENMGGAGGFEAGMAAARERFDPDWMVLMDDDARPAEGSFDAFRALPEAHAGGPQVIAAAVTFPDGDICEMNRPGWNPFWHGDLFWKTIRGGTRTGFKVADRAIVNAQETAVTEIDVASFVGFFVNRAAIDRAGLPEGGLFIYGDDVLYSLRLRRAGVPFALRSDIRFEHDCKTMGTGFVYRPLWKVYYHCRNGVSIARQSAGLLVFPLALAYYLQNWWRKGRYYEGEERRLYRRLLLKGVWDGLWRRRGRNDEVHQMVELAQARGAV